ncbi:Beta-lactamase [Planctomycetes bacterium Poly30]|uniref:Beta-lactamase n=1 Tax=Saltatorellus ferox TaxID=2528018 RepID=A0A518EKT2_9BACT|nr:Beta-lactamase [Planctomycetes bacterium Poly30]
MHLNLAVAALSLLTQATVSLPSSPDRDPGRVPGPYDFRDATTLLEAELPKLSGNVAVLVRQNGREIYRFQRGTIDFDTQTRMASLTKSLSSGVILGAVEDGLLTLDERVGDAYPLLFPRPGIGDATVLDCWAMRHGIDAPLAYEHLPFFTHWQSVVQIGTNGFVLFPAGERLGYDGAGMQVTGYLAAQRAGLSWEALASQRILHPLGMNATDYLQFTPNPCVPGGARSTALDVMRFADMILDEGQFRGQPILQPASIERFFTNHTRGLPVEGSPFPAMHPDYPYGVDPDYGFGGWVLAEHPTSQHVEEIVGAGAWGSFVWMDRRRGLTAALITDVPAGSQASVRASLGLFTVARAAVEARQIEGLRAAASSAGVTLSWTPPAGARSVRVVGSQEPIRDVFDLRHADVLGTSRSGQLVVPPYPYYAATAALGSLHNSALIPGVNSIAP